MQVKQPRYYIGQKVRFHWFGMIATGEIITIEFSKKGMEYHIFALFGNNDPDRNKHPYKNSYATDDTIIAVIDGATD